MRISVEELGFAYDGRPVLEEVSLEVREGEILALVGPNGSGKTTLLRNIAGVLKPNAGAVYLDLRKLSKFGPRQLARHLAAVEQERQVGFDFTVEELVELGRLPHLGRLQQLRTEDREAVQRAMELTNVSAFAKRPISQLSGGERQRVFLAIALAQQPQILLLDEPTAHLDINYQIELMEIVKERARKGLAVLMALHDLNLAAYYAHRMALLHRGRIADIGPPGEVLTARNIEKTFRAEVAVGRNPLTGAIYIELAPLSRERQPDDPKHKAERVHIVCGGGSGAEVLRALAPEYTLSAGVLSPLDTDYKVARHLGIEIALEAPFAPIADQAYRENLRMIQAAEAVVLCAVPFGPGNLRNLEAASNLRPEKLFLLDPEGIAERDYTGGRATFLIGELLTRGAIAVRTVAELKEKLKERKDERAKW